MRRAAAPDAAGISHIRPPEAKTTVTTWPGRSRTDAPSSATVSSRWCGAVPCRPVPLPTGLATGLAGMVTVPPGAALARPGEAATVPREPVVATEPVPQAMSPAPARPMTTLRVPERSLMPLGRQAHALGSLLGALSGQAADIERTGRAAAGRTRRRSGRRWRQQQSE